MGKSATTITVPPNAAATNTSRRIVGGPDAATTRPPTTAPAPINDDIVASPLDPAPNVNSDSSGSVVVNS